MLALQGDFREHVAALARLGANAGPVRTKDELAAVDALVFPGGESTTMDKLLRKFDLQAPLRGRIEEGLPVLATCAGLILLADNVVDGMAGQESIHALPVSVRRNGYGRQPDSFEADLEVRGLSAPFHGVFIRAPVIERVGDDVEVLAKVDGAPVAIRHRAITALAFHPELTGDDRLHELFLSQVEAGRDEMQLERGA